MEQERIAKALMEGTLEIVIIFNGKGRIISCNRMAKEALLYDDDIYNKNIAEILRKSFESGKEIPILIKSLRDEEEAVIYRKNGTCFRGKTRISLDGETGLYYLFALDIESCMEMQQEVIRVREIAAQAMEVKNEFVANVTHELRTPVNGIKGHVELLRDTGLNTQQRKTLDIIEHCCNNMSAIINNILDFSKLQAGKFQLDMEKFEFREMMENIIATNMAAVNEKGLQLTVNIDENIPRYLTGDELRLTQILNNLISNAVKFTLVGFIRIEVTMTLRFNHEIELFFMVTDSGIGISREEQDRLFKSFSQVDASITRKYGGTGLGLAITKELVELMKGKVYLESEKGRGSNFSFSVRLQTADDSNMREEYKKEIFKILEDKRSKEEYLKKEDCHIPEMEANHKEIESAMEKIVLSIELGAWEKAELWAGELKNLLENCGEDIRRAILKLEMAVRKEDYDAGMQSYEKVRQMTENKAGD